MHPCSARLVYATTVSVWSPEHTWINESIAATLTQLCSLQRCYQTTCVNIVEYNCNSNQLDPSHWNTNTGSISCGPTVIAKFDSTQKSFNEHIGLAMQQASLSCHCARGGALHWDCFSRSVMVSRIQVSKTWFLKLSLISKPFSLLCISACHLDFNA